MQNGEECGINNWVIAKANDGHYFVAKVAEILQIPGSEAELSQQPDYVLILLHSASFELDGYYKMPKLTNLGVYELAAFKVSFNELLCQPLMFCRMLCVW